MGTVNQALANEILQMAEADQAMRLRAIEDTAAWDNSVDQTNQERLMEIVHESGWPTIPKVGAKASHAAWLLVQHAPALEFMERCLDLMEALPVGEVRPADIAYLKDRVLMLNGRNQIYGTQFQGSGKEMHVWPIDDVNHVDQRRADAGLSSFAENEARLRELYKTN